jgi:hypothetical protein
MRKIMRGFCPVQNKAYAISIDYINASTLSCSCYEKGTFRCEYNIYGDNCSVTECPLYSAAPQELR